MSNLQDALAAYKAGELLIVVDDENRENEGDLMMLAEAATPQKVAFMVKHTTGILCVAMTRTRARELKLPLMVENNQDARRTAFTVSVDFKDGLTTGVSATERSATVRALANTDSVAEDFIRPGHVFPLIARSGGLQERSGHTEAGVALSQAVGGQSLSLLSEIVRSDGEMARMPDLEIFAKEHGLHLITVAQLSEYVSAQPALLSEKTKPVAFEWAQLPLRGGAWEVATYSGVNQREHVVLKFGKADKTPLVRIHSECFTGDVVHSQRCDCGEQLERSIHAIAEYGFGYIIYLRDHEGRGIGLSEKIKAYALQDQGLDTVEANLHLGHEIDARDWSDAVDILHSLGVVRLTLLTNNPQKVLALTSTGIEVERRSLAIESNEFNEKYLHTKEVKLGHVRGGK